MSGLGVVSVAVSLDAICLLSADPAAVAVVAREGGTLVGRCGHVREYAPGAFKVPTSPVACRRCVEHLLDEIRADRLIGEATPECER